MTRPPQPPLAVLVAPLTTRLQPTRRPAPALALVLITDPAAAPALDAATLQQLFALSVAEAGVAQALAAGQSVEAIAAARGVSLPTVRTQIRQLLTKTGAPRLQDLVRLLTGLPTVRQPDPMPVPPGGAGLPEEVFPPPVAKGGNGAINEQLHDPEW